VTATLSSAARAAADAVDPAALADELAAIIRIPSVTGSEEAVAAALADRSRAAGLTVEVHAIDPAGIRADPAWPGEETERTVLPLVLGSLGRRATRQRGPRIPGAARSVTGASTAAGPAT
jgi:acetylornithine deacetylase